MEEDKETKKSKAEVEADGLGLIEFASEDDSLLFSSFPDPTSYEFSEADADESFLNDDKDQSLLTDDKDQSVLRDDTRNCVEECLNDDNFSGDDDTRNCVEEILVSTVEEKEEVLQPHESPEPEKVKVVKSGKYNLRKSLAWDNAFFTSAGVLEPEELSSMMESNHKSERKALPIIEEDLNRSTESISTFQSDCSVDSSQEFLFEDVRASIQRSAAATPAKNNELGATGVATSPTSSTVDAVVSQGNMKSQASPKKAGIRVQGLGKALKQPVAARGLSTSISKPPNGLNKVRPLSAPSTNRASLDISKTKQEKNSRLPAGKEPSGPRIPISRTARPTLPKPAVLKSTLRSSVASKNDLASSCSSLESCASASSSVSHKSSLDSMKKKNDSSSRVASQSLTNRSTSRGSMGQPRIPPHPTNKTSKPKLSSSRPSSAGSISDCSSESSRASAKGYQKTVAGEKCPSNDNTVQTVRPLKNSKDASLVQADAKESMKRVTAINGGSVPSGSMKPSGLRVPQPKIGFFDGARNGSSPASKKSGKSQIQESPRSRLVPASSPKPQNKLYSKVSAEDQLEG